MKLLILMETNLKSLFLYFVVIGIAGTLNLAVWGTAGNKIFSLGVLILSMILYFILGFFLNDKGSVGRNIQTVVLIPILSLLLYLGTLLPASDFSGSLLNSFNFLYFVTIQPFLGITGIPANFDNPLIFAIAPALLLWCGLQTKAYSRKERNSSHRSFN